MGGPRPSRFFIHAPERRGGGSASAELLDAQLHTLEAGMVLSCGRHQALLFAESRSVRVVSALRVERVWLEGNFLGLVLG